MTDALAPSVDLLRPAVAAPSAGSGSLDAARRARIAKIAQDFEASFTSVMLGQMFEGVETSAPFGGGEGEGMFKSFLSDAMAKAMAKRGGIGLGSVIQKEMLRMQGLSPTPSAPPVSAAAAYAAAGAA